MRLFREGVVVNNLDRRDPGASDAVRKISPQIKLKVPIAWRSDEMAGRTLIVGEERLRKLRANLVRPLGDAWADRRTDAAARGSQRGHLRNHGLGDSCKGAPPAGMPRADDSGNRLVKQDWRAIGRKHAERDAGNGGDQPVRARGFFAAPRSFHG